MSDANILNLGNVRKTKKLLASILDQNAIGRIEQEIEHHVQELYSLGLHHFRFAIATNPTNWRQKVSRLYYAGFTTSRAVRLYVSGDYSKDVKDHQKFDNLPGDFPTKATYANRLKVLREARNTADYNHSAKSRDLINTAMDSSALVKDFIIDSHIYLQHKGLTLRGKL